MSLSPLLWPNNQAQEISPEITLIPEIGFEKLDLKINQVSKNVPKYPGKRKNSEKSREFTVIPGKTSENFFLNLDAKWRRWATPLVTRFGVITRVCCNEDLI